MSANGFKRLYNGVALATERTEATDTERVFEPLRRRSLKHPLEPLPGEVRTCTIRRYGLKWYACLSCEVEAEPLPASDETVGIDVGLEKFASLSTGEIIPNPRFFRREEKAIAQAQRKLSKQAKGTKARSKAKKVIPRIHERTANRRHSASDVRLLPDC